jgi:hypothetical protein
MKGYGSLRAYQGKEEGVRNERRGGLFIEKVCHQFSDRVADVWQPLAYVRWSLHIGLEGVSYVQALLKGYSKSSVRLVVSRTSANTIFKA